MTAAVFRVLVLLRFLCFMAIVYLTLHALCVRMIAKPESKVLWFFSVVTGPLTWPLRMWLPPAISTSRLLFVALGVYGTLWGLVIVGTPYILNTLR